MKKIYDYELNQAQSQYDKDEKKSPFAIYEDEYAARKVVDRPTGIITNELHKHICTALAKYLVLTSDLLKRLFNNNGLLYDKEQIQKSLRQLKQSAFIQAINFENSSGGRSSHNAYVLGFRGTGYVNALGIHLRMGNYIAACDAAQLKKILACNQLVINGNFEKIQISQIVLREPKNPQEKACHIFRPTGTILNTKGEICQFIESVRRTPTAQEDMINKIERMLKVFKEKEYANVQITNNPRLIVIGEDYQHICELIRACEPFRKKLDIVYSYDLAIYSSQNSEDFLYEYIAADNRWNFFRKTLAACF